MKFISNNSYYINEAYHEIKKEEKNGILKGMIKWNHY